MRNRCATVGITDKTAGVHTLRRTYATALIDANLEEKSIQSWMGHKDFRTTKKYYDMPDGMPEPTAATDVSRAIWGHKSMGTNGGTLLQFTRLRKEHSPCTFSQFF